MRSRRGALPCRRTRRLSPGRWLRVIEAEPAGGAPVERPPTEQLEIVEFIAVDVAVLATEVRTDRVGDEADPLDWRSAVAVVGRGALRDDLALLDLAVFEAGVVVEVARDPGAVEAPRWAEVEFDAPAVVPFSEVERVSIHGAIPLFGGRPAVAENGDVGVGVEPRLELRFPLRVFVGDGATPGRVPELVHVGHPGVESVGALRCCVLARAVEAEVVQITRRKMRMTRAGARVAVLDARDQEQGVEDRIRDGRIAR